MARPGKTMVSVDDAAKELGVSRSTVWRMIRRGELPSLRKGGRRLVPRRALSSRRVARRSMERLPPFTRDNPIFRLVGAYSSGGRGPGSEDKYAALFGA